MAKTKEAPASAALPQEETIVESTDVMVIPEGAHAVANLGDVGALVEEDAGKVNHGFSKQDIAIPFLRILQSNSPQTLTKQPTYLDGAETGMFLNTATNELYPGEGVTVVPVAFQRQATLWWPRDAGGPKGEKGFVREVPLVEAAALLKQCTKNDKNKDVTPEGQELVFAAMYYCLMVTPTGFDMVAFPLTSTQLKKGRAWNALILGARLPNAAGTLFNPKMYGFSYKLETVPESNAKGHWMGVKITRGEPLLKIVDGQWVEGFHNSGQLYLAARELEALVNSGRVQVKQDDLRDDGGTMSGGDGGGDAEVLPF